MPLIGLESLVQSFLHRYSNRIAAYVLDRFEERLWPVFRSWLRTRLNRSTIMTESLAIELKVYARFFKFVSCEDGRILGGCMVAGDQEPGVYNEVKIQIFDGLEWSLYDQNIPDDQAQEFVRRAVEYEIKEMFVVRPAVPVDFSG